MAAVGFAFFIRNELRAEEPLFPLHLFQNRIFTVSALVTLISGFAMMGSLFYIPLFVQGVLGSSATRSGLVTMPMMITMAISSAIAGQLMSRLGRYRVLGIVGLVIMVAGMAVLSQLSVNSTRNDVTFAMIIFGIGLGTAMPLYMLSVQNAVDYRFMGIATSSMQFLRSVGGTMGVAILFSIIQSQYHHGIEESVPAPVQEQPALASALDDPQFLLNDQAQTQVESAFAQFGDQGDLLFEETLLAVRTSLADGIAAAFLVSTFVLASAVVVGLFMKEIPLRRTHALPEEESVPRPEPVPGAGPALRPIEGGAPDAN